MIGYLKFIILYYLCFCIFNNCSSVTQSFYISNNNVKCSLINLRASVSASYGTITGNSRINLFNDMTASDQKGICGTTVNNSFSEFNISWKGNENLNFHFKNVNNYIILTSLTFIYKLPNVNFPNATSKGTVTATGTINKPLSTASQFYQCSSYTEFNLSHGVTVHVDFIKLRVFNVTDETFGDDGAYCTEDASSSATDTSVIFTGSQSSLSTLSSTTDITTTSTNSFITTTTAANSSADPKFVIKNSTVACLLLQSKMTLSVNYQTNNGVNVKKQFLITNHTYGGKCGEWEENVNITIADNIFVNFRFNKTKNKTKLYRLEITIFLSENLQPKTNSKNKAIIGLFDSDYEADGGMEYYCKSKLILGNATMNLAMVDLRFETFRTSINTDFSDKISGTCLWGGLTTGQIFSILLFALMVTILFGLSLISLIRKCLRYYRYQKVLLNESS